MNRNFLILSLIMGIFLTGCREKSSRLFVGGYTKQVRNGLYVFDFNLSNGRLDLVSQNDAGMNPSYFCYSKKDSLLYAANEVEDFKGPSTGGITTLRYNASKGTLEKKNEIAIPNGGPCFISLSPDSGYLFAANYPKGSVVVVKLGSNGIPEAVTDSIFYESDSLNVSHAHMIMGDPPGKRVYVSDLGLDRIMIYNFDKINGKLIPVDTVKVEKRSGPRHFVFNSDGSVLYLINELGSKMMVFKIDQSGHPALLQTLTTYREGFKGENYCADVHISNDGRFLYGSNRGENTIVTFNIASDGTLKVAGHTSCGGNWPRNFTLDPEGKFILVGNERSDTIAVYRLNKSTGLPLEPGRVLKVTAPACLKFF